MKRITLLTVTLFSFSFLFGQIPIQTIGNSNTVVRSKGYLAADSGYILTSYPDTITANKGRIATIPFAQIVADNKVWLRNSTATAWEASDLNISAIRSLFYANSPIKYADTSGAISADTGILATKTDINTRWGILGNSTSSNNFLGTLGNSSLRFRTYNTERMVLDSVGTLTLNGFVNGTSVNPFTIKASDATTNPVFNVSSWMTGSALILKPNNTAFTADGSSSGFGPLRIAGSYIDSFISMGAYKGMMFQTQNGFKFRNPSGTPTYLFSIESNNIPQFYMRGNGLAHIGDTTSVPSSIFTVSSTNKGFLTPRMTTTQKALIASPAQGLMVWDSTQHYANVWTGSKWAYGLSINNSLGSSQFVAGVGDSIKIIGDSTMVVSFNSGTKSVSLHSNVTGGVGSDGNNYLSSVGFSNGALTFQRSGLTPDLTQSIDGRYVKISDSSGGYATSYQNSLKLDIATSVLTYATIPNLDKKIDSIKRKVGSDSVFYYNYGGEVFAFTDSIGSGSGPGGGAVDSIKNINSTTQRVYYHDGTTKDLLFQVDSVHLQGDVIGRGIDTIVTTLNDSIPTDVTFTGHLIASGQAAQFNSGIRSGPAGSEQSVNFNVYGSASANTKVTSPGLLLQGTDSMRTRVQMKGVGSAALNLNEGYANLIVGSSPISAYTSGNHPWITNSAVMTLGAFTRNGATISNTASLLVDSASRTLVTGGNYSLVALGRSVISDIAGVAPVYKSSALLNLESTTKGFLMPRLTTVQRDAVASPNNGLLIFNSTTNSFNYYNGGWASFGSGINSVDTFGTVPNVYGASISGSSIVLQPADASNPGGVSTTNQTFGGTKTFPLAPILSGGIKTANVSTSGNFFVNNSSSSDNPVANAQYLFGKGLKTRLRVGIYGSTGTVVSAKDNVTTMIIGSSAITTPTTDSVYEINQLTINAPTVTSQGAVIPTTTLIKLDSVTTVGQNNYSIWSLSGIARFDGGIQAPHLIQDNQSNTFQAGFVQTFTDPIFVDGMHMGNSNDLSNTFLGYNTPTASTGQLNTSLGSTSLQNLTSGNRNTALGSIGLLSNTTGSDNTAIGANALVNSITTSQNTAIGSSAGVKNKGANNTFIGYESMLLYNQNNSSNYDNTFYITGKNGHDSVASTTSLAGINTIAPNSTFQVNGSFAAAYVAKTINYTATASDYTISADGTSGAFAITLPTAVGITGRIYVIRKSDASGNTITVSTTSSQQINGSATYTLGTQYKYVTVQSSGSAWMIIGNN